MGVMLRFYYDFLLLCHFFIMRANALTQTQHIYSCATHRAYLYTALIYTQQDATCNMSYTQYAYSRTARLLIHSTLTQHAYLCATRRVYLCVTRRVYSYTAHCIYLYTTYCVHSYTAYCVYLYTTYYIYTCT